MIRIQLVDDEPNVLNSLRRLLRRQDWQVDAFSDVEEALEALLQHEYAVILSDYKMPMADGVTYLKFAKQKQPGAIRLVLSGHGDSESMVKAINQAEVFRYLTKPWDDHEVVAAISSAVELYRLQKENQRLRKENDEESRWAASTPLSLCPSSTPSLISVFRSGPLPLPISSF